MVYYCLCHAVALTPLSRFGELKPSHIPIELQTTALMHRDFGLAPNSTLLVHLIKEITAENRAIFSRCLYPDPGSNRDGFPHRCLRPTRLPIPPSGPLEYAKHILLSKAGKPGRKVSTLPAFCGAKVMLFSRSRKFFIPAGCLPGAFGCRCVLPARRLSSPWRCSEVWESAAGCRG